MNEATTTSTRAAPGPGTGLFVGVQANKAQTVALKPIGLKN